MNTIPAEFDEIRPYMPHELPAVYEELIADPEFKAVMGYAFKDIPFENIAAMMRGASTNIEFQKAIVYPFVKGLLAKFSKGISFTCDNENNISNALCISNHRDIILDSAFLCIP